MRKYILIMLITALSGFQALSSMDLDYQVGGGYSGYFPESQSYHPVFGAGFGFFGGVGYKILPILSGGVEYEYSHAWAFDEDLNGFTVTINQHIPKAYLKLKALNILTLTVLGGVDIQNIKVDGDSVAQRALFFNRPQG